MTGSTANRAGTSWRSTTFPTLGPSLADGGTVNVSGDQCRIGGRLAIHRHVKACRDRPTGPSYRSGGPPAPPPHAPPPAIRPPPPPPGPKPPPTWGGPSTFAAP